MREKLYNLYCKIQEIYGELDVLRRQRDFGPPKMHKNWDAWHCAKDEAIERVSNKYSEALEAFENKIKEGDKDIYGNPLIPKQV